MLSVVTNKIPYPIVGSVPASFEIPFKYFEKSEIKVLWSLDQIARPGVAPIVLNEGDDYELTEPNETGILTRGGTWDTDGIKLTIYREVELKQKVDLRNGDKYDADKVENMGDYIMAAVQQVWENISRTVRIPITDDPDIDLVYPPQEERAGHSTSFNATGTEIIVSDRDLIGCTPFIETLCDDPDAETARETIDVYGKDEVDVRNKMSDVTTNITMESDKKYIVSGNYELTLPSSPIKGDVIEILSDGYPKIIQDNAEHVMSYKNKYYTTKGVTGFIHMNPGEKLKLVYKGTGLSPIEPMVRLSNPVTTPTGESKGAAFSPDDVYLAIAHLVSPYITIYKRNGDTFTKLANPASLPTDYGRAVEFSHNGTYLVIGIASSPFIEIYKRSGDTFTKLASPGTLPVDRISSLSFSPDDEYLAATEDDYPWIIIYKRSGDTFTKIADPASLPTGTVLNPSQVSFAPDGNYLTLGYLSLEGSPWLIIYKRSGDIFTKLPDPSTPPVNYVFGAIFSPGAPYLFLGGYGVSFYKRNGDTYTKLGDPTSLPASASGSLGASKDGMYYASGDNTTPYIYVYRRNGDTFTKLTNPADLPRGEGSSGEVVFSNNGTYLVLAESNSPYLTIYKLKENVSKEWIVTDYEVMNSEDIADGYNGELPYRFN